jgi:hypothetical protein
MARFAFGEDFFYHPKKDKRGIDKNVFADVSEFLN